MSNIESNLASGILTITINRPDKKNALTADMYADLAREVANACQNEMVRVVVLRGEGENFTSGNDISLFVQTSETPAESPALAFMKAVSQLQKPLIACVRGYAIGIGATVLCHCDFVIATPDAQIRFPFVDLGLCPEFASTLLLPSLVGKRKAKEWMLLCNFISASEALEAGLINQVLSPKLADDRVAQIAANLSSKPAAAMKETRNLLEGDESERIQVRISQESDVLNKLRKSDEAQAIFRRFLEKKPVANR